MARTEEQPLPHLRAHRLARGHIAEWQPEVQHEGHPRRARRPSRVRRRLHTDQLEHPYGRFEAEGVHDASSGGMRTLAAARSVRVLVRVLVSAVVSAGMGAVVGALVSALALACGHGRRD